MPTMPCPDSNTFAAFMDGALVDARRSEIEAHLDGCPICGEVLANAARCLPADTLESMGRYQLVRRLGVGGMGVVVEAIDPTLERSVAVKLLRPDVSPETGARLVQEAKSLARIAHPNVVRVLDAGAHQGQYFLVMELMEGVPLSSWLQEQPRTWREVLAIFQQIAAGLAAVHAAGLTHRDLKPENVLINPKGEATVIDFGLAVEERPPAVQGNQREVAGTLAYMAPEQWRGESVGPAADQFAFCVMLWEALFGERPVVPGALQATALRRFSPVTDEVPLWLRQTLERGLQADPSRRWADLGELSDHLEAERARIDDGQRRLNALFQLLMLPVHIGLNALMLVVLTKPESELPPEPTSADVSFLAGALATWLIGAFLTGWAPLGLFWTPINAYGLWRRRAWAFRSTAIYALFALPSVIGTPFAIYAMVTLWRRAFPRRKRG